MNFIKSRLSRDNFWNLVFWIGMIASGSLMDLFANFIGTIFFFLTLTVVPYWLARLNKVTYTEDKIFLNKQGQSLKDKYPSGLMWILIITVPVSTELFFAVNKNFPLLNDRMFMYTAIALLCPMVYFILKNCPISILFNKNAWCSEVTGFRGGATYPTSINGFTSPDPYYTHRSSNIHHRK